MPFYRHLKSPMGMENKRGLKSGRYRGECEEPHIYLIPYRGFTIPLMRLGKKPEDILMWLLKEFRQQIGTNAIALPAIPWHCRAGADSVLQAVLKPSWDKQQKLYLSCYPGEGRQALEAPPHFKFLFKTRGPKVGYRKGRQGNMGYKLIDLW